MAWEPRKRLDDQNVENAIDGLLNDPTLNNQQLRNVLLYVIADAVVRLARGTARGPEPPPLR